MAKKVGIGVAIFAALLGVFFIVVATRPSSFRIERSKVISASPEAIYGHVADFRKWSGWSPWEKMDPNMKRTFGGTQGSPGATYAWAGNTDAGEGVMTVQKVDPNKRIDIELKFTKPMESVAQDSFTFEPAGKDTKVTWSMYGDRNFVSKMFCMFMDMDQMIGKDFEKGLDAMKQIAESTPAPAAAAN